MTYKILVIDDHPETLNIIQRVLQQQEYDVIVAHSGAGGLAIAEAELPDLVLLDVMMPEMDGREVCRRLRSSSKLRDVPIIMFSALSEADEKLAGFNAGADDYLTKPTDPAELTERVKVLLAGITPRSGGTRSIIDKDVTTHPSRVTGESPAKMMDFSASDNVIVVIGARGGAGATTTAINLAVAAAEMGQPTWLVDLDLFQGHVALYLNQKVSGGVNALAGLSGELREQQVAAQLTFYQENLQLLLAQPNLFHGYPLLSAGQAADLAEIMGQSEHCVIVDVGRGITATTRPFVERASQIVVCLRPERVALAAARQLLETLRGLLGSQTSLYAVLMDFSSGVSIRRDAIEEFLGQPLQAHISILPQELAQSVNKGTPLVKHQPTSKAAVSMRQLARQLAKTKSG